MKKLALLSFLFCPMAMAETSYEVCTYEGPCALRVIDTETQADIWLVTEASLPLMTIWDGAWYLTTDEDYQKVRSLIPESERWTVRGIDPTSGQSMEAKTAPKPSPSGGPLVTGSITVNTTIGGAGCTDCHKGSNADIHKKKMNDGGK